MPICGNVACDNINEFHGAHVFKVGCSSKEYIVPLCPTCNSPNNTEEMEVPKWLLIKAN